MDRKALRASALLLLGAFIWGTAFVAQSIGMDHLGPYTYTAIRCLMGGIFLAAAAAIRDGRRGVKPSREERKTLWKAGLLIGICLCFATNLQQIGILYSSVGKSGFITAFYIVLVPVLGVFVGRRSRPMIWVCAVLGCAGLYFLFGGGPFTPEKGDLALAACALFFAVQILLIDRFGVQLDSIRLCSAEMLVCGLLSCVPAVLFETLAPAALVPAAGSLLYAGILSSGVAYTLQIAGQRDLHPAAASLIMSLESVISALAGWAILHQKLSPVELTGCALMFAAVVLVQLPEKRKRTDRAQTDQAPV